MKRPICFVLCVFLVLEGAATSRLPAAQRAPARVIEVAGANLTLDQGAEQGFKHRKKVIVYYMQPVAGESVRINVALAQVLSTTDNNAVVRIKESTAPVQPGYLVSAEPNTTRTILVIAGAVAAGIIILSLISGNGGSEATTGTISVDLPAN